MSVRTTRPARSALAVLALAALAGAGLTTAGAQALPASAATGPSSPATRYSSEPAATWQVSGVRDGSRLNVRSAPGTGSRIVARLAAGQRGVAGTGRAATVAGAAWRQVRLADGSAGWAASAYLARQQAEPRHACRDLDGRRVCDTYGEHDEGPGTTRPREDEGPGTTTPPARPVVRGGTPGS